MKRNFILFFFSLITFVFALSIFSYHPNDPSIFVYSNQKVANLFGVVGATIADFFFQLLGFTAYLLPLFFITALYYSFKNKYSFKWIDLFLFFLMIISISSFIQLTLPEKIKLMEKSFVPGGVIGNISANFLKKYFNFVGAFFIIITFLISSIKFLFRLTIDDFLKLIKLFKYLRYLKFIKLPKIKLKLKKNHSLSSPSIDSIYEPNELDIKNDIKIDPNENFVEKIDTTNENNNSKNKKKIFNKKSSNKYNPPPIDFLKKPELKKAVITNEHLHYKAEQLLKKFNDFRINGEIKNIIKGPTVTLFEFKPDPKVKLSTITGLQNDITMALKAQSVRIVAPIPGKDVVGIEVSNPDRETVYFRELIESDEFKNSKSPLTIAIGKTIDGKCYISDLAKMPHLLVAGSTGSGKSVCINVIITSILYKASFKEVRFILIDPKKLELSFYNDIPHLLLPVISEPEKAPIALKWAIYEMERRYDILTEAGVRDIAQYNEKVKNEDEKLPYIVIIIDELADLMMVASKEIETSIARLTQKARAAGIHMILATQRPSVDVITGLIKNNLPSRIAFKVTSRADSRTILDHMGAESLLGMGDMLFLPPGTSNVVRLQGAFITEQEILKIIEYLKQFTDEIEYMEDEIMNFSEDNLKKEYSANIDKNEDYDPLWDEAVAFVSQLKEVSISLLQRKFKIGYNRSAKIIEKMEEEGIVGPADGSKPRKVLIRNLE